ncbi:MAG: cysteine desulfurase family protein [Planctomycetota bacterium]|nr:cysteine desulfurase family protein [Planctomycetota bacterium]
MIYLDYNATTPIDPGVAESMRPFIEEHFGNPSSGHPIGHTARVAIERARASVASLIGGSPEEIVFTSGGTEASNWAIRGVAESLESRGRHIVTSNVEHPATLKPIESLARRGFTKTAVAVDGTGQFDPDEIRRAIQPDTILISVLHAQNEVGTIEPVAEVGRIAREAGVLFHVDAAQSIGKVPVNVEAFHADLVSIAGHKLYGPKGIGALYVRKGVELPPLIEGAHQEGDRRAGTENVIMAVGLGRAAELASSHLPDEPLQALREYFWDGLSSAVGDRVMQNGHPTERLPGTLNVSFPGYVGGELLARLDGVCASTGAACHAGDAKPSAVLTAMGFDRERSVGAIRFSVGRPTTRGEVEAVVSMLEGVLR